MGGWSPALGVGGPDARAPAPTWLGNPPHAAPPPAPAYLAPTQNLHLPPPPSCHHPTLQAAVKAIAARVARAGIDDLFGAASAGGPAVGAGRDDPKKLDLVAVSPGGG